MGRVRDEAAEYARAAGESLRAATSRADELAGRVDASQARLARIEAGEEVPRAIAEAERALERATARADLALAALADEARRSIEASPLEAAEAERRAADVSARARKADALSVKARAAREREVVAEREAATRRSAREAAARARAAAEASEQAASRTSMATAREIEALLVAIQPAGQHDLFARASWPVDPSGWARVIEAQIEALVRRADAAESSLELARASADRSALAAREASGRRVEANRALSRARTAATSALARTGFADAELVRRARLAVDVLAELEAELAQAEAELAHARAVFRARARDVDVEIAGDEASSADEALDEARRRANEAADEAAAARERATELTRRRARALEIGARIEALAPRVERLARLKHVTQGGLLSELAAERHLQAVTRAATELLRGLSSDRYGLVRRADGSFGIADAAHGGLVRAPSSLSGGETFLVSLSLALSLSERIQIAGRTRFDFFFLDEGFGSLDAATLDTALGALERLRDAGRVIGVISHVPTVEERMPCRLRVVPGRPPGRSRVLLEMG
jgi:exonuclease SbcC